MPCCAPVTNATFPAKRIARLLSAVPGCCARLLRRANYPRQFGGDSCRAQQLAGPIAVRSTPASLAGCVVPLRGSYTTLGKQTSRHVVAEFTPIRLNIQRAKLH